VQEFVPCEKQVHLWGECRVAVVKEPYIISMKWLEPL